MMSVFTKIKTLASSRVIVAAVAAVATAVVVGGVSYASIPDPSGVIHGCYKAAGSAHELTVVNSAKTTQCPAGYKRLNWSQTGPQGTPGTNGVTYDCSLTPYPGIDLAAC
jgi:hypothetical protein